jgi:hypothetical protein
VKIKVIGKSDTQWVAVIKQMEREGDEIVTADEQTRVNVSSEEIPILALEALGYRVDKSEGAKTSIYLSTWFDYELGWHPQTFMGAPVFGLMDENLGPQIISGFGGTYTRLKDETWRDAISGMLVEMKIKGFVTFGMSSAFDIVECLTGIPFPGLLCLLEGVPHKISRFFAGPMKSSLLESKTIAIVFTRPPYPYKTENARTSVDGLTEDVLKHFWIPFVTEHRKSFFTDSTLVGVATNWSMTFGESNFRALQTCRAVRIPERQYRTDIARCVKSRLEEIV